MALAGDMWFEGFAIPWVAPRGHPSRSTRVLQAGCRVAAAVVSVVLFVLGWILFGLASFRSRAFPKGLSIALAVGGLIGFWAGTPPWGVALGLAVAAVGVWLIRHRPTDQGVQAPGLPSRSLPPRTDDPEPSYRSERLIMTLQLRVRQHPLIWFAAMSILLSWWAWPLYELGWLPIPVAPFGPFLAALLILMVTEGKCGVVGLFRRMGRWRVNVIWYVVALATPVVLSAMAMIINLALGAEVQVFPWPTSTDSTS